jgi:acetyl esterase/lipase
MSRQQSLDLVAEQRAGFAAGMTRPAPDGVRVRSVTLGGRPALEIRPDTADGGRRLLYLHGGGYVIGSPGTHTGLVGELALRAGLSAVSVDYRLAPEHAFPAAVDDGLAAYRELLATGTDPRDLVLAGDSAGGGLVLATLLAARDAGLPLPAAAVLFSPWTDLTLSGASIRDKAGVDPVFASVDDLRPFVEHYAAGTDPSHPLLSPARADLTGLPPLLVQVGTDELLLDDSVLLARRADAAGVDTVLEVGSGLPHVYQHQHGILAEADAALDRAAAFLVGHLTGPAVQQVTPVG